MNNIVLNNLVINSWKFIYCHKKAIKQLQRIFAVSAKFLGLLRKNY